MAQIGIQGRVLGVQDVSEGTFFFVQTVTGDFEKLYNQGGQFDFIEVGAMGIFYVEGMPVWNPFRGNWEAVPRIIKFSGADSYSEELV